MQGEEETQPTTKKTVINILKVLIIGILVVIASRIPFLHKNYEFTNSEYSTEFKTHKAKYKKIVKAREIAFENLISDLKDKKISVEEFATNYQEVKETSALSLREYTKTKKQLLKSYKYKGFNAYYFFLLSIGTPIMALILCLLFFYILMNPITTNTKRLVFSMYGSLFLFTSTYFILHALYSQQVYNDDFPVDWYVNIMRYVPILVSFTIPVLFYHYQSIEQKLKTIIHMFFHAIYRDIPDNDFIKHNKKEAYRDFKIEITDKVVNNE